MVNRKPPGSVAPPPMGLPCGECGLPGLVVRPAPRRGEPLQSIPMLICRFCRVGVVAGLVSQRTA